MIRKIITYIIKPEKFVYMLGSRGGLKFLPDSTFLKLMYKARMGKNLNLENPETFNEKIQWLKLYDRNPLYSILVDKYRVRDYVANKCGDEYLIPLLGKWDTFDSIDFNSLPQKFVLKTTHDSGGVVICYNKNKFDKYNAKNIIEKSLKHKYSTANRERVYDDVKPQIIAEQFLETEMGNGLNDYKFFCFDGKVKALFIASDRESETKFDFFDRDFKPMNLMQYYPNSNKIHEKPENFSEMIRISEELSKDIPHVRVDLYNYNNKIYFGELTFYHFSGARKFEPEIYDKMFGDWIKLPG